MLGNRTNDARSYTMIQANTSGYITTTITSHSQEARRAMDVRFVSKKSINRPIHQNELFAIDAHGKLLNLDISCLFLRLPAHHKKASCQCLGLLDRRLYSSRRSLFLAMNRPPFSRDRKKLIAMAATRTHTNFRPTLLSTYCPK